MVDVPKRPRSRLLVLRTCPHPSQRSNTEARFKIWKIRDVLLKVCVCQVVILTVGLSKQSILYLSALEFIGIYLPFFSFVVQFQSAFWECCSVPFEPIGTLWPEGECTACTFSGCHNGFFWCGGGWSVFLWPKVQPLWIQGHGILGPFVKEHKLNMGTWDFLFR